MSKENLPELTEVLTDAGNLKSGVHKEIRSQLTAQLKDMGFEETLNGNLAMQVALADGRVVYARLDAVVTMNDPFVKKEKVSKKKQVNTVIPKLFE